MKPNTYTLKQDHAILTIHSAKYGAIEAKVDLDKVEDLKRYNWFVKPMRGNFYAQRSVNPKERNTYLKQKLRLHQYLLWEEYQTNPGKTADHLNRDTLDNRLANLRMKNPSEQALNQSLMVTNKTGFRGASYRKDKRKYVAQICVMYNQIKLGYFATKEEAAAIYNYAATILHGSHAQLNQVDFKLTDSQKERIAKKIQAAF